VGEVELGSRLIRFQKVRKLFTNLLSAKKCDTYSVIQNGEAIATLHDIIETPERFRDHLNRYSLSVARSVAYGKRVGSDNDAFAVKVRRSMEQFAKAMTPGRHLVESIPALRYLPRPLQPWLKELTEFRDYENEFSLENYRDGLESAEKFPHRPSVARDMREELRNSSEVSELQAATTCMEILGAGSDTTANSLTAMVQACVAFPEVVEKAHEELDRVVGHDRFPTWADEPNLPYLRAMIKEQHRWRTISPMSATPSGFVLRS
jgi:cytochrome P450